MLPARAEWLTRAPEAEFKFQGRSIDPRCVMELLDPTMRYSGPVSLAECAKPGRLARHGHQVQIVKKHRDGWSENDSYTILAVDGTRFVLLASKHEEMSIGESQNEFLAVVRLDGDVLSGEAFFAPVSNIELNESVHFDEPPEGVRLDSGGSCELGAMNARVEGHVIRWSQWPDDIFQLGKLESLDLRKDLDMDDMRCAAKSDMEYDLDTATTRLMSVTLREPLKDQSGSTEKYTYQRCFNAYFNTYVANGRAKLDADGVKQFAADFDRTCVGKSRR